MFPSTKYWIIPVSGNVMLGLPGITPFPILRSPAAMDCGNRSEEFRLPLFAQALAVPGGEDENKTEESEEQRRSENDQSEIV